LFLQHFCQENGTKSFYVSLCVKDNNFRLFLAEQQFWTFEPLTRPIFVVTVQVPITVIPYLHLVTWILRIIDAQLCPCTPIMVTRRANFSFMLIRRWIWRTSAWKSRSMLLVLKSGNYCCKQFFIKILRDILDFRQMVSPKPPVPPKPIRVAMKLGNQQTDSSFADDVIVRSVKVSFFKMTQPEMIVICLIDYFDGK